MLYSNACFPDLAFSHLVGLRQLVAKQTIPQKSKQVLAESYSVNTSSIRKQLLDMLDIELELSESEAK